MIDVILVVIGLVGLILLELSSWTSWRNYRWLRVPAVRKIGVLLFFTDDGLTVRILNNSEIALIVARIELSFLIPDLGATKRIELSKQVRLIQRPVPLRTPEQESRLMTHRASEFAGICTNFT